MFSPGVESWAVVTSSTGTVAEQAGFCLLLGWRSETSSSCPSSIYRIKESRGLGAAALPMMREKQGRIRMVWGELKMPESFRDESPFNPLCSTAGRLRGLGHTNLSLCLD